METIGDDSCFAINIEKAKGSNVVDFDIRAGGPFDIVDAAGCLIAEVYPYMKAKAIKEAGAEATDRAILETITSIILSRIQDRGYLNGKI